NLHSHDLLIGRNQLVANGHHKPKRKLRIRHLKRNGVNAIGLSGYKLLNLVFSELVLLIGLLYEIRKKLRKGCFLGRRRSRKSSHLSARFERRAGSIADTANFHQPDGLIRASDCWAISRKIWSDFRFAS